MKTTKLTKQQIATIKKATSVLKTTTVLPVLENAYIHNGCITITDLNTYLTIKNVGIEGQFLLGKKELNDMLALMPEFNTEATEFEVAFTSPDNSERFKYTVDSYENFVVVPKDTYTSPVDIFANDLATIQTAIKFIGRDELRPAMMHVCLSDGQIAATDAHMLYFMDSNIKVDKELLINGEVIKFLALFGDKYELSIGERYYKLQNEAVEIICRLCDERYPAYRDVLPTGFKTTLTVDKKALIDAVNKADKMTNSVTHALEFELDANKFVVSGQDITLGTEYSKDLTKYATVAGEPVTIYYSAKFLQKLIGIIEGDCITFQMQESNRGSVVNGSVLIMPIDQYKYKGDY